MSKKKETKTLGEKLAGALHAGPTARADVEAAVWPKLARTSVTGELPNWWTVGIPPAEASRGAAGVARTALAAVESYAGSHGFGAGGLAAEAVADPKARPGHPRVRCERLGEPELRLRLAMAHATGSDVACSGVRGTALSAKCNWSGEEVTISPGLTVGRAPIRDIVLPEGAASRLHGTFRESGGGLAFEDARSTNGTDLNGEPAGGRTTRPLRAGDTLTFAGRYALTVL